jgi:hypothetical protein
MDQTHLHSPHETCKPKFNFEKTLRDFLAKVVQELKMLQLDLA